MNKPNTKDLRLLANEYFDGRFDSQDVKNILTQCADFIDALEGKTIVEWPEGLTKKTVT